MFIYDKDMERVMMAKKKEVLQEIETAKLRVLKELYCIKRGIHTDMCEMLADYNRIDFNLKKAIKDAETKLETTVKEFQKIIADALEEHNRTIETKLNELSALQSSVISEVNTALADLNSMKTTVENLIVQCQTLIDNGVTQADLDELRSQLEAAIASAGVQSDWDESDETNKAYIKNKPFYIENVVRDTSGNLVDVSATWNSSMNVRCGNETNPLNVIFRVRSEEKSGFYERNYTDLGFISFSLKDGKYVSKTLTAFGSTFYAELSFVSTDETFGNNFNLKFYVDATNYIGNTDDGYKGYLKLFSGTKNVIRPDIELLGKNPATNAYLMTLNGELSWSQNPYIFVGDDIYLLGIDNGNVTATKVN